METRLGYMTLREAEAQLPGATVLVPFGAQEAHGPHLPLGADILVAEEVAVRAARQTQSLVAPAVPYGYAPSFRGFAGNVSTRPEITQLLAEDIIAELAASGATHFVLVDNHAGNDPPLEVAARRMQDRFGVAVAHFYPWKVMLTWGPELFGDRWTVVFGHGAEPNTSVMLYLTPENVRMADAAPGGLAPYGGKRMATSRFVEIDGVQSQLYLDVKEISTTSVTSGDPTLGADPEIGRVLVERCAAALVSLVAWHRQQRRPTARS